MKIRYVAWCALLSPSTLYLLFKDCIKVIRIERFFISLFYSLNDMLAL